MYTLRRIVQIPPEALIAATDQTITQLMEMRRDRSFIPTAPELAQIEYLCDLLGRAQRIAASVHSHLTMRTHGVEWPEEPEPSSETH